MEIGGSGFLNPRGRAIKILEEEGYVFYRHGSNHDIYLNQTTRHKMTLKRHDFNENDIKNMMREINRSKGQAL